MDVTVTHLNSRLALQLPAQLPLGLVFVLGDVENLNPRETGQLSSVMFDLVEKGHRVRCMLSERAMAEVVLHTGDKIRAGGHLAFDLTRADYFLLVRDVEVVQSQAAPDSVDISPVVERELVSALADMPQAVEKVVPGDDLPVWVKKLAPPEFRTEAKGERGRETAVSPRANGDTLNAKQLAQLSAALDSEEDVELTDGLLEIARRLNQARGISVAESRPYAMPPVTGSESLARDIEDPDVYKPTGSQTAERILLLVVMVALALFLLIMVAFITGVV